MFCCKIFSRYCAVFFFCLAMIHGVSLVAQERPYFLAPITSELQRDKTNAAADSYALIDIDVVDMTSGKPDLSVLMEAGLKTELAQLSQKRFLYLMTHSHLSKTPGKDVKAIKEVLRELALEVGFEKVVVYDSSTSATWRQRVQAAEQYVEGDNKDESVIENDYVRVFPIRTKLSKLLAGEGDCYVEIFRPIDGTFQGLEGPLRDAIVQAVQKADLQQKNILIFQLQSTSKGEDLVEKIFTSRERPKLRDANDPFWVQEFQEQMKRFVPSPALLLAEELGFQSSRYRHSPGGGTPENVLAKVVPNIQLPTLDGSKFDLHRDVQGIPTVITFWGLACGPCRQEAPHLSNLQKSLGNEKLRIVAVNAYKDKREDVAKYVEQEKLSQLFVLDGETLAKDIFGVSAYPTTFFVDRTGTVVDYEIGFFSESRLQKKVEKLLHSDLEQTKPAG